MQDAQAKRDWVAKVVFLVKILLIFRGRSNRFFRDIRLKIYRLPNFNMLFQLVLNKFLKSELFTSLPRSRFLDVTQRSPNVAWHPKKRLRGRLTVFVFTESWSRNQLMQKAYLWYATEGKEL